MSIGEICNREVVIAERTVSVAEVAALMRQYHVGDVVVVESVGGRRRPVGVVTDRDLVVEVMAPGLAPDALKAGDMLDGEVAFVRESEGVFETIRYMRSKGVRRMPVVDPEGWLLGIVALDDLVALLAEEMQQMAALISTEQRHESERRK